MKVRHTNSIKTWSLGQLKDINSIINKNKEQKIFKNFRLKKPNSISYQKRFIQTTDRKNNYKINLFDNTNKYNTKRVIFRNKSRNYLNSLNSQQLLSKQKNNLNYWDEINKYFNDNNNFNIISVKKKNKEITQKDKSPILDLFNKNNNKDIKCKNNYILFENTKSIKVNKIINIKKNIGKIDKNIFKEIEFNQKKIENLYNNFKIKNKNEQKLKYRKIRIALKNFMINLVYLQISPKNIYNNQVFSNYAFQKENSKKLFFYVKTNNIQKVKYLLDSNKFLIYDYDNVHNTVLHWACKRGFNDLVEVLLKYNPDVDFVNLKKESSLILALKNNNYYCAKLLLLFRANPFSTSEYVINKHLLNKELKGLIKFMQYVYIIYQFIPLRIRIIKYFERISVIKAFFLKYNI